MTYPHPTYHYLYAFELLTPACTLPVMPVLTAQFSNKHFGAFSHASPYTWKLLSINTHKVSLFFKSLLKTLPCCVSTECLTTVRQLLCCDHCLSCLPVLSNVSFCSSVRLSVYLLSLDSCFGLKLLVPGTVFALCLYSASLIRVFIHSHVRECSHSFAYFSSFPLSGLGAGIRTETVFWAQELEFCLNLMCVMQGQRWPSPSPLAVH